MPTEIKAQNTTTLASVKAIYDAADQANTLLDGMQTAAIAAGTTLDGIYQDAADAQTAADDAQASADNASEYAARALGNLSTVQNITETLNWITAHGTMTLTSDVALDPTHVYFVVDPAGDYVVGGTHYSVVTEPDVDDISTYYELSINESLNNYVATHLAVDSEGLWIIPDAGGNKVLIATGSGSTYTTAGTYIVGKVGGVDTVLAEFTASGTQIGQTGDSHLDLDYHSLQLVDKEGTDYFHVSDLRGANGTGQVIAKYIGNGADSSFILPAEATNTNYTVTVSDSSGGTISKYTTSVSFQTPPTKGAIITVTYNSSSDRLKSYTLGMRDPNYTTGIMSYAEGVANISDSFCSHAEGFQSSSRNWASHAEGEGTAEGQYSHAEGWGHAIGKYSHAEGEGTYANGEASHAQNMWTTADGDYQTALGRYNIRDYSDTYSVIIGNGSYNNPSNALTVDWSGNVMAQGMAGMIQMFAGSTAPTGWLMCDGSAVSRTTYAKLFSVIGTTYGTGDGSTTFNLPDLRGRMPLGSSSSHLLASTGGSEYIQAHTHSNTIKAKTPKFTHSISSSNSNVNLLGGGLEQSYGKGGGSGSTYPYKRLSVADHAATDCTMSGSVGAVSGATTGNEGNMPPFLTINYIIATGKTA